MYMNAKRWRETKYTARAALRKPRGLPSERDVLQNRSKKKKRKMSHETTRAIIISINNWLQKTATKFAYAIHVSYKHLLHFRQVSRLLLQFLICFSDVSFIFYNLRVIPRLFTNLRSYPHKTNLPQSSNPGDLSNPQSSILLQRRADTRNDSRSKFITAITQLYRRRIDNQLSVLLGRRRRAIISLETKITTNVHTLP